MVPEPEGAESVSAGELKAVKAEIKGLHQYLAELGGNLKGQLERLADLPTTVGEMRVELGNLRESLISEAKTREAEDEKLHKRINTLHEEDERKSVKLWTVLSVIVAALIGVGLIIVGIIQLTHGVPTGR